MRPRAARGAALAFAGFFTLLAAFFSPVWLARKYIGDPVDQLLEAVPSYLGSHPLWEPRTMLGYPLAADPNQGTFYPLIVLRALPGSFDWYEIAAYAFAAFGVFGLVRASTRSTLGALVGGCTFAFGGFMIGHAGHTPIIEPAAWVPYLFWSLTEMRSRERAVRSLVAFVAALALTIVAGHTQTVVYALFFALPYAALAARHADDGVRAYLLRASAALILGIGCAADALVPQAELFHASARASFGFERFQEFTVPVLQEPLRLFFPYALGQSTLWPYEKSSFNVGSFAEMSNYAGICGIGLAIVAMRTQRGAPFATYWIAACAAGLLLATGNQLGIAWITYHVPLYDLFRAPGRNAAETDLALAVLAGFGIAAIESGRAKARDVARSFTIVAVAMGLTYVLFAVVSRLSPQTQDLVISGRAKLDANVFSNAALWIPIVTLGVAALVFNAWSRAPGRAILRALVLIVVVADMLGFAAFAYWRSGAFGPERLAPPPYLAELRSRLAPAHQRVLTVALPGIDDGGIGPNLNLLWDVASLRGYMPLQLTRTRALFDSDWDSPFRPLARRSDPTLDLAAVRFVIVVERPDAPVDQALVDPVSAFMREGIRFRFVRQIGNDTILENSRALARAWVVHRTLDAAGLDTIAAMDRSTFDPSRDAYVEVPDATPGRASSLAAPVATRGPSDVARVTSLEPSTMRVRVRCATPCYLVTSDTTYPGWIATIDGTPTPIYPTDEALRGVAVPSGAHDVEFRYGATSFAFGVALSCVCVCLTLALATILAFARRSSRT